MHSTVNLSQNIAEKFIEVVGSPISIEDLHSYITFCVNNASDEDSSYREKHHVLPRSLFSDYENEEWNIVSLKYEDHCTAHYMLAKIYPIREFSRTLNFMNLDYLDKDPEEIFSILSESAKRGWEKLKDSPEKYDKWRKSRSESQKLWWKNASDEYMQFHNERTQNEIVNLKRSKSMIEKWADPDYVETRRESFRNAFGKQSHREQKRVETQNRWDSMSTDEKLKFNTKMNDINKSPEKRDKASARLKELWADPEWRAKREANKLRKKELKNETNRS